MSTPIRIQIMGEGKMWPVDDFHWFHVSCALTLFVQLGWVRDGTKIARVTVKGSLLEEVEEANEEVIGKSSFSVNVGNKTLCECMYV